jgi:hypothetical protein
MLVHAVPDGLGVDLLPQFVVADADSLASGLDEFLGRLGEIAWWGEESSYILQKASSPPIARAASSVTAVGQAADAMCRSRWGLHFLSSG